MKRIGDKPMTGAERQRRYRERHPEKAHEEHITRYWSDPQGQRDRVRKYRQDNPEKIREYNHKYVHSQRGKMAHRIATRKYKALKKQAVGTFTIADVHSQYKRQKGRCYYCNKRVRGEFHVDHVIPINRGGRNSPDNIVISCPSCNIQKGDKLPHEWAEGGRLL